MAPSLSWETVTSIPDAFGDPYVSATYLAGRLYALTADYEDVENALHIYDFAEDLWSSGPAMPGTGRLAPVALAMDGRVWVAGGYETATAERLTDLFSFDPTTSTWSTLSSMRVPRFEHAAAALDGKLYVFGGHDGRSMRYENTAEVYDIASDTWTDLPPMPHARKGGAAVVVGGKIWLVGGVDVDEYLRIVDVYDPQTEQWTTEDIALREARFGLAAAPLGSMIVVTGGSEYLGPGVGEQYSTTVEVIDPAASWSSYGDGFDESVLYGVGIALGEESALIVSGSGGLVRRVSL